MREAKCEQWSIVFHPDIYSKKDTPEEVYATFQANRPIALFGRAKDDPRHDPETGAFKDGNRLVSGPIVKVEGGRVHTGDTIWSPGEVDQGYLEWCKQHNYSDYELADCILQDKEYAYRSNDNRRDKLKDYVETVIIPADVTSIEHDFYGWGKVENFRVEAYNAHYADVDGVLFDRTKTVLIKYPEGRRDDCYSIPDGVVEIAKYAFSDYSDIFARFASTYKNRIPGGFAVYIPASVQKIGDMAFNSGSRRLEYIGVDEESNYFASSGGVLFDKNLETLICCPAGAQPSGSSNRSYVIPETVKRIEREGFSGCALMTRITLHSGLTHIGDHGFEECVNLLEITIPGTVKSISRFSFSYCFKLTNVILQEGVERIESSAFAMCNFLKNIFIPRTVTEIDPIAVGFPTSLTIYCYEGSFAHTFAKERNLSFVLVGDTMPNFKIEDDAIPGLLRIESETLEDTLMGDPEIAGLLNKIAGMAGPIIIGNTKPDNPQEKSRT